MLGAALLGWGAGDRWRDRMRAVLPDAMTLVGGAAILLVWAGLVEAFFSQYHEPTIPYVVKILAGSIQLTLLIVFLSFSGRAKQRSLEQEEGHA